MHCICPSCSLLLPCPSALPSPQAIPPWPPLPSFCPLRPPLTTLIAFPHYLPHCLSPLWLLTRLHLLQNALCITLATVVPHLQNRSQVVHLYHCVVEHCVSQMCTRLCVLAATMSILGAMFFLFYFVLLNRFNTFLQGLGLTCRQAKINQLIMYDPEETVSHALIHCVRTRLQTWFTPAFDGVQIPGRLLQPQVASGKAP